MRCRESGANVVDVGAVDRSLGSYCPSRSVDVGRFTFAQHSNEHRRSRERSNILQKFS